MGRETGIAAGEKFVQRLPGTAGRARRGICEYLLSDQKIAQQNIDHALTLQADQDEPEKIGSILVKLGYVSEHDVAESLAKQLDMPLVDFDRFPSLSELPAGISENFLRKNRLLILREDEQRIYAVMSDPQDDYVIQALSLCTGKMIVPHVGVPSEIDAAYSRGRDDSRSNMDGSAPLTGDYKNDVEQLKELAGEAPVIKLVNQFILRAAEAGASDIHIEPFESQLKIRYRIDGMLRDIDAPPMSMAAAVVSRVKIMANLDIAERRLAQDGRFRQRVRGVEYDFRVSTVPTMHGESVVMRLLKRDQSAHEFEALGFSQQQADGVREILANPHGILLVTGPTGSGKSTTLYAALNHMNDPERMIITIEDPVEYNIPGINQMQVKPQIGLTFAYALRSIVRQDPDVIMIGEMRDSETARIAVQSALTGHLVLSTLHTNDAPSSVMRLIDMGIQDYLLTSAVNAVLAQRLVRKLCEHCREAYTPLDEVIGRWDLERLSGSGTISLYRATGCDRCNQTGYDGRTAILELLRIDDSIKGLVLASADATAIRQQATADGMETMITDGLRKSLSGVTTLEEVMRVAPEFGE
jgi:general secretion pathway protein E